MKKPASVIFCMQASVALTSPKAYQVMEYSLSVLRKMRLNVWWLIIGGLLYIEEEGRVMKDKRNHYGAVDKP